MKKLFSLILLPILVLLSACAKSNFTESPAGTNTGVSCETNLVDKPLPTNILFIVDQSGSNANGPFDKPGSSTDPKKLFRFGIMNNFIGEHGIKKHLNWNLVSFSGNSARSLVSDSSSSFTNSLVFLLRALDVFMNKKDEGNTPYKAALQLAKDLIEKDKKDSEQLTTLIAFITDGYPTDYCPGGSSQTFCAGKVLEDQIDVDVRALTKASQGKVQFSTVYYGPKDSDAAQRLARMALVGGGQFIDLNDSTKIDLNDVIQVPEKVCQ